MTEQTEQAELWEELKVEHHWFHIVRAMVLRGKIAEMGVMPFAVYVVIKAHTALNDGRSFPSQPRIAKLLGVSVDTVARATEVLTDMNIVKKSRAGRHNQYHLNEEVPMVTPSGEVYGVGVKEYSPMGFTNFIEDLKRFAKTGEITPGSDVKIVLNVTVNQNFGDGTQNITVNNVDVSSGNPQSLIDNITRKLKSI